ncbi:DNA-binding protein [Pseudomonas sp. 5Ae-yellow]|uniref:DNA-binding protein n=1 Tax=Pseudomonas sp. 5Ae-yellow TaxID=2759848 RepID=UPI0015F3AA5B|nr:DNA-binding protein [Pseudomonas sp. 5Ae-yellow]MBA6421523.1 DNA-binding protein [Pseudomonas sp. 5Ae-yellow]|tara:strand:- start:12158 stop:12796 length:639 start_codon:yes stop_codon:yes gene_type:complete
METKPDVRARIIAAADKLYQEGEKSALPKVEEVRRAARASMGDTSAVMKEWRRQRISQVTPAVVTIPEPVLRAHNNALAALWRQAQELANEALLAVQSSWDVERQELDVLREEVASAYETQAAELEKITAELAAAGQYGQEMAQKLVTANGRADRFETRVGGLEVRVAEVREELDAARKEAGDAKGESAELRGRLAAALEQNSTLMAALQNK